MLALDFGLKRIGTAVGDTELRIVVPGKILSNDSRLMERITDLVRSRGIGRIVVGMPLTPSGKEGERAKRVKAFVEDLKRALPDVPVETWDERYTTQEAERRLADLPPARRKKLLDSVSAQIILEEYLNSLP